MHAHTHTHTQPTQSNTNETGVGKKEEAAMLLTVELLLCGALHESAPW